MSYANWRSGPWSTWVMVDGELFLLQKWFTPDFAQERQWLCIPMECRFVTKPEPGLSTIWPAKVQDLPFEAVVCDDLYGLLWTAKM